MCAHQIAEAGKSIGVLEARIARRGARAENLDSSKVMLNAQLLKIPVAQQKEALERRLSEATGSASRQCSAEL